jgi:hypothetical protein
MQALQLPSRLTSVNKLDDAPDGKSRKLVVRDLQIQRE